MELLIVLAFGLALYFLPAMVAYTRGTSNRAAVLVVTLFLGWTFLGWVVALAMAVSGAAPRKPTGDYLVGRGPDGLRLPPPPR